MGFARRTTQRIGGRRAVCRLPLARATGIALNTVRKYFEADGPPRYGPRPVRPGKLEPFKTYLAERVKAASPDFGHRAGARDPRAGGFSTTT